MEPSLKLVLLLELDDECVDDLLLLDFSIVDLLLL